MVYHWFHATPLWFENTSGTSLFDADRTNARFV